MNDQLQMKAIKKGFSTIIPIYLLKKFNEFDLDVIFLIFFYL